MSFLPIVARELRVGARRPATYRVRSFSALVVILGGVWLFLFMNRTTPRELGQNLFLILSFCAIFFGLMSGCFSTADCLSEEKREGTLGLLFLTDLKTYDIILGKLVANSLNAFYNVAAVVPLLAIPLILGGLTPGDFVRMALVAMDALFFSLAAGVFVSSFCRSSSKAIGLTFLLVLFFAALLPAAGAFLAWRFSPFRNDFPFLSLASPLYAFGVAPDKEYQFWAGRYWGSLVVIHSLGWLFLTLASAITPRVWQDRPARIEKVRWREHWRQWWSDEPAGRAALRQLLLGRNPFCWLVARNYRPAVVWGGLGLIACGWLWGLAENRQEFLTEPTTYILTALCAHTFLRISFAAEVPWQLARERRAGTLELLLCTPLTVPEIVQGQKMALQRQFLAPFALVIGVDLLAIMAPMWTLAWPSWNKEAQWAWVLGWLGALLLLAADVWALFWVGLWQGLIARTALRATSNALGNVFMIPCVVYALFLLWLVLELVPRSFRGGPPPGALVFFLPWFLPRLLADAWAGLYAREKLLSQFRLVAQQNRDPRPGFWGWWLGWAWRGLRGSPGQEKQLEESSRRT